MIIDIHTHIAGMNYDKNGNYLSDRMLSTLPVKIFMRSMGFSIADTTSNDIDERFAQRMITWLNQSSVDRAVFLAYDAVYGQNGTLNWNQTHMVISNDFVAKLAEKHKKVLFGASIHPYRHDAISELERQVKRGACLIKWLPTAQNIDLHHSKSIEFYEALAHYNLPLLCHTGQEKALITLKDEMNDPYNLTTAIERGVTVIAAHCGSKSTPFEKCYYKNWEKMALEYEHFYGDISAFGLPARVRLFKKIKKSQAVQDKMLYGSDIPVPIVSAAFFPHMGLRKALQLQFEKNPFERNYQTMKHINICDKIFHRAADIIKFH